MRLPPLIRSVVLLLFLSVFYYNEVQASHAMGADLTYRCLGGLQYEVTLKFYRDCKGVWPFCNSGGGTTTTCNPTCTTTVNPCTVWGNPTINYVSTSSCAAGGSFTLTGVPTNGSRTEVTPVCPTVQSTCSNPNSQYPGAEEWVYSGIITLPAACPDWVFSFAIGNRNAAITTIQTPSSVPIYVESTLNNTIVPCNSSPSFTNKPVPWVCVGQKYCFNHGALDADGDSLVYSLVTPKTAATTTVAYNAGYSATSPVNSSPALTLDPITGDICMTPTIQEVTVMAVKVDEWRNGVKIGSVIRDMQIVVIPCTNTLPTASGINGTTSYSTSVCENVPLCFDIITNDADAGQTVTVSWNNGIAPGTFTFSGTPFPTARFCWTPSSSDVSTVPYIFTVSVKDNACPYIGSQTFSYAITVIGNCGPVAQTTGYPVCPSTCAAISASGFNGLQPYTYSWSSGQTGSGPHNVCPLSTTTYTVTIADNNGVTATDTAIVTILPDITLTPSKADVSCFNGTNGSGTITAGSGTSPYTYTWSPSGGSTATATGLSPGNYTVTVRDNKGCSKTSSVTIANPPAINLNTTKTDVNCGGGNNGTATTTPSGGTTPYTYLWSPAGGTNPVATGLTSGTFTVTVTDNRGCTSTSSAQITQPVPIALSNTKTDISCGGGSDGTATVIPSGGTSPYTYSWSPSGGTGVTATGLTAGIFTVTVTDNMGCSTTSSVQVTQPSPVTSVSSKTDVSCNGGNNGTATATPGGGTSPYTYTWSPAGGTSSNATGLSSGMYVVTVTDNNGCSATSSATVNQPTAISLTPAATAAFCGALDGAASITPAGGTSPYTYFWSPGSGTTSVISNISGGTYTVTVRDISGCSQTSVVNVPSNGATTASITTSVNVTCEGGSDGSATAAGGGGVSPFTYLWSPSGGNTTTATALTAGTYSVTVTDNTGCPATSTVTIIQPPVINITFTQTDANCGGADGTITINTSGGAGSPYTVTTNPGNISGSVITGLTAGPYSVTVSDANGCTNDTLVIINDIGAPLLTVSNTNILCNGNTTGTISSTVTAGISPYTFIWAHGPTSQNLSNLSAGTYTLTVRGNNNCTATQTITVTEPPALTHTTSNTDANCGASDATACVTVSGGTGSYSYIWSPAGGNADCASGIPSGNYTVTVTDGNGCTDTVMVQINDIGAPAVTVSFTNVTCYGAVDGSGSSTVTGGVSPYSYIWSPLGGTAPFATGLSAGTYTVTVTGANGCKATSIITITQPPEIIPVISSTDELCGNGSGTATVTVSGGTGVYTYLWSNTMTTDSIGNLNAGNYTVTVTDASGCTKTMSVTVNNVSVFGPSSLFDMIPSVTEILAPQIQFNDRTGGAISWQWDFGDSTFDTVQNPLHIYKDTGTFNACLTITNTYGCISVFCSTVVIKPIFTFYVPNVFSPDGDGKNDLFSGYGFGVTQLEMFIFDRWGDMVFHTKDIELPWDGKMNGGQDIAQEDVYIYLIIVKDVLGGKTKYMGNVTLVR